MASMPAVGPRMVTSITSTLDWHSGRSFTPGMGWTNQR